MTNQSRSQFGSRTLFVLMFVGVIGALSVRKYGAEALPWIMTIVLGVGLAMVGAGWWRECRWPKTIRLDR